MKRSDISRLTQVFTAPGTVLVTSRNIHEEKSDPCTALTEIRRPLREELRHYGKCQQVTIIDYDGHDYSQEVNTSFTGSQASGKKTDRMIIADLHHGPFIGQIDMGEFDRMPGCSILIRPKFPVRFQKVTVKVCDLLGNVLAHDIATDPLGQQEWIYSYFHSQGGARQQGNLRITIRASEKPRARKEPVTDDFNLLPGRQMALTMVC